MEIQNDKIYYISMNNWFAEEDFPPIHFVKEHMDQFGHWIFDDEYCKENQICVVLSQIDMSENICITAKGNWVRKNCFEIIENEAYHKFLFEEESGEAPEDRFYIPFADWDEKNFHVQWFVPSEC